MITPEQITEYARTWIGARWVHQGRGIGRNRGIDCAGLLVVTAQHFGLPCQDLLGYRRNPGREFVIQIGKFTTASAVPVPGAIGIFTDTVQPCHAGIFAERRGQLTVIHAEAAPAGRVHEEPYYGTNNSLESRLMGIRHFMEVAY